MKQARTSLRLILVAMLSIVLFAQCDGRKAKLHAIARLTNLTTPINMGEGVTMVRVNAMGSDTLQYVFRVDDQSIVDEYLNTPGMYAVMEDGTLRGLISDDKDTQELLAQNYVFLFTYTTASDSVYSNIVITPEMYNNFDVNSEFDMSGMEAEADVIPLSLVADYEFSQHEAPSNGWRCTSVTADGESKLIYSFQGVEHLAEDFCTTPEEMKQKMIRSVKLSENVELFRHNNVSIQHIYFDKEGEQLYDITIFPNQY